MARAISLKTEGQTIKSIVEIIDTMIDIIRDELKANNQVSFQSFIKFENKKVKAKSGEINGIKWQKDDRLVPTVKLMKKFKDEVQNEKC